MKMIKKIMLGAVAVSMLALVGCKVELGLGDYKGTRYDGVMTVDATEDSEAGACETVYRRYFKQISTGKKVGHFETEIAVNPAELGNSVVGIAFDVNTVDYVANDKENGDLYKIGGTTIKDEDGNDIYLQDGEKVYDFVLVGFKAATKKAYVEHYVNVPKALLKAGLDTNEGSMGNYYSIMPGDAATHDGTANKNLGDDWFAVTTGENEEGWTTVRIAVTQDFTTEKAADHIYKINVGGKTSTYTSAVNVNEWSNNTTDDTEQWCATGAVCVYGNAYANYKVEAAYKSNRPATGEEFGLCIGDVEDSIF